MTNTPLMQQHFDTVAKHLFAQGERCGKITPAGHMKCLYRGPNGTKCAIGALIPDELYDPRWDERGTSSASVIIDQIHRQLIDEGKDDIFADGDDGHYDFYEDLQTVHDIEQNWFRTITMRDALGRIAREYSLNDTILDTLSFNGR